MLSHFGFGIHSTHIYYTLELW